MEGIPFHKLMDILEGLQQPAKQLLEIYESFQKIVRDLFHVAYNEGFKEGRRIAFLLPDWRSPIDIPDEDLQIIAFLDNGKFEIYTYRANNKELKNLFQKHVLAWMYAPQPPRYIDKP